LPSSRREVVVSKYRPAQGGHAPIDLRAEFEGAARFDSPELWVLSGQLWNCTDVMPDDLCGLLDVQVGSTFAQGARRVRPDMRMKAEIEAAEREGFDRRWVLGDERDNPDT
jgi:hypothetical protein